MSNCNILIVYPLFLLLFLFIINVAPAQTFYNDLEDSTYSAPWINVQISDSGNARSGNHFSLNDGEIPYGLGIEMPFPDEVKNKNTVVKIEGWVENRGGPGQATFVISLDAKGKSWFWKGIDLSKILKEKNQWARFSDSLLIPANVTATAIFKAYLWNRAKNDTIAIDDLKFEFSPFPNPTYVPELNPERIYDTLEKGNILFTNNFYQIEYIPAKGRVSILNTYEKRIVNSLSLYSERETGGDTLTAVSDMELVSVKKRSHGADIRFEAKQKTSKVTLILQCNTDLPGIRFLINEKYATDQEIIRESVVLESNESVTTVYRSNRKSDTGNFQPEYWLDKEGVKFGNHDNTWLVYHAPDVSSLQLKTDKKQLWVNLDYEKDHPFLHFPLNNDTTDEKADWSESTYKKGAKRQFSFTVYVGIPVGPLPRFMKNPEGYLATYIWTGHADFTDIRTNRAVYFGSENIVNANNASGGFVKYHIPVTKSVFYDNPDGVTNTKDSDGLINSLECSIMTDSSFYSLLEQLHKQGDEICLHTPENYTSTHKRMKTALRFMRDHFGSPTWIDHGYNNHLENNREDLVCDGTVRKSGNYMLKLWKKYGVRYFYNPYYEDYSTFGKWAFFDFTGKPYAGFGDFLPNPDFWKHPTRTGDIVHWPTKGVFYAPRESDWNYYFNDQVLNEFIAERGVKINHCYPPRVNPAKGFWEYGPDSTIIAAPGFNNTLKRMFALKKAGLLNVTTIKDFLDYRLAVENVKYDILPDGSVKVTNMGNKKINGLSFVLQADSVGGDGLKPEQKIVDREIVFWFDLKAGESKVIASEKEHALMQ